MTYECIPCEERFVVRCDNEDYDVRFCPFCGERLPHELELEDWNNEETDWDEIEEEWDDK